MARPKEAQPTAAELEVLKVVWQRGPSTVREVMDVLNQTRPRAYTSVMSLLNVMTDKGLLEREPEGRAFRYAPAASSRDTLGGLLTDLLGRAFEGSASTLVAHLLDQARPSTDELREIRELLDRFDDQRSTSR